MIGEWAQKIRTPPENLEAEAWRRAYFLYRQSPQFRDAVLNRIRSGDYQR